MKRINHEEFIGKRFGKVTVKSFSHSKIADKREREYYFYNYECECGSTGVTGKHTLLQAKDYSCKMCRGFNLGVRNKTTSRKYDDPVEAKCSILYSNYKTKCKSKKWEFNLSFEQFKNLVIQNCHYCGLEPNKYRMDRAKSRQGISRIYFNGIDRVENNKGYSIENCVPCCEDCNIMKSNMSEEEFKEKITKIYKKWIKQEDTIKIKADMN